MRKIISASVSMNKANGQIRAYFKKERLPQEVIDAVSKQDSKSRLILQLRGVRTIPHGRRTNLS